MISTAEMELLMRIAERFRVARLVPVGFRRGGMRLSEAGAVLLPRARNTVRLHDDLLFDDPARRRHPRAAEKERPLSSEGRARRTGRPPGSEGSAALTTENGHPELAMAAMRAAAPGNQPPGSGSIWPVRRSTWAVMRPSAPAISVPEALSGGAGCLSASLASMRASMSLRPAMSSVWLAVSASSLSSNRRMALRIAARSCFSA